MPDKRDLKRISFFQIKMIWTQAFLVMLTIAVCSVSATAGWSQSGYVWMIGEDSVRRGDVRQAHYEGEGRGVEIKRWNKQWERYQIKRVREFATKRDTFRVFNELQLAPGKSYWMEVTLVKPVCRGQLNLYALQSPYMMSNSIFGTGDEVLIMEDSETGAIQPLTGNIDVVLRVHFSEEELETFFRSSKMKPMYPRPAKADL